MHLKIVSPILGFENIKEATLKQIDEFFYELLCDEISFTLIDAKTFKKYEFNIPLSLKEKLKIKDQSDIKVLNIVTILNPIENSTINFLAPIIINTKEKLLAQVILDENKYKDFGLKEPIKKFL